MLVLFFPFNEPMIFNEHAEQRSKDTKVYPVFLYKTPLGLKLRGYNDCVVITRWNDEWLAVNARIP